MAPELQERWRGGARALPGLQAGDFCKHGPCHQPGGEKRGRGIREQLSGYRSSSVGTGAARRVPEQLGAGWADALLAGAAQPFGFSLAGSGGTRDHLTAHLLRHNMVVILEHRITLSDEDNKF